MNEFFVDLLPDDARRHIHRRSRLRLFKFGAALILTVTVGGVTSSFVELRHARAEHSVIVSMRDRANRVDELLANGVAERAALHAELGADSVLRSPVETTEIVATIANLLPQGSWLESLRVSLDETKLTRGAPAARPVYTVQMNGRAGSAEDVQALATSLRKTQPFVAVTVVEQRTAPRAAGGTDQQFVMRLRVNPALVASDEVVSSGASTITQPAAEVHQ
ncbi:MAG: hypothetical protein EXS03_03820 [Phycisphaerales bacterium]|nr:hypothetical protein [Phycisphaerales bacterium]